MLNILFMVVLSCIPVNAQNIITVDSAIDDQVNTMDSNITLREAISIADRGDIINFDHSLSGETITLTRGEILIFRAITIDASNLARGITIDANATAINRLRVFNIRNDVTMQNLIITGG